jgi:putative component of toxin-antitoxin plasmid stabilization module
VYDIQQTEVFSEWLHALKDNQAKARIRAKVERAGMGNFGGRPKAGMSGQCG